MSYTNVCTYIYTYTYMYIIWGLEDYIAEAGKQLNDESVYKSVKFKENILQNLAEKSNGIFKVLSRKVKLLKDNLSIL